MADSTLVTAPLAGRATGWRALGLGSSRVAPDPRRPPVTHSRLCGIADAASGLPDAAELWTDRDDAQRLKVGSDEADLGPGLGLGRTRLEGGVNAYSQGPWALGLVGDVPTGSEGSGWSSRQEPRGQNWHRPAPILSIPFEGGTGGYGRTHGRIHWLKAGPTSGSDLPRPLGKSDPRAGRGRH